VGNLVRQESIAFGRSWLELILGEEDVLSTRERVGVKL
jgi:hypothetical protein